MPEPITAEYFTSRGVDAATAQRFAAEHNRAGGLRDPDAPAPSPTVTTTARLPNPVPQPSPTTLTDAQRAQSEIAQIRRDRADGKISDYEWRTTYERKVLELAGIASSIDGYKSAPPGEKAAQRTSWDADATQAAIEKSLDEIPPARSPWEYSMPGPAELTDEEAALDRVFREGLHSMGAPRELGSHLGESIHTMAEELLAANRDPAAEDAIVERHEQRLRERWGAQFDNNVGTVRELLREVGMRSPQLRELVENHPELYSGVDTMGYLLQLAQRRQRARARGGS